MRFTRSREAAAGTDELELLGLDHPIMEEELGKARNIPPEQIGLAVNGNAGDPVMLSCWLVETSGGTGERRTALQLVAVKEDGTRLPAIERQADQYFGAVVATAAVKNRIIEPRWCRHGHDSLETLHPLKALTR